MQLQLGMGPGAALPQQGGDAEVLPFALCPSTSAAPLAGAQVIVSSDYGESWTPPQLIYAHEAEDEVPKVRALCLSAVPMPCCSQRAAANAHGRAAAACGRGAALRGRS